MRRRGAGGSSLFTRIMVVVAPVLAATAVVLTLGVGSQTVSEFVVYLSEQQQLDRLEGRQEVLLQYYARRIAGLLPLASEAAIHSTVDRMASTLGRQMVVARNRDRFYPSAPLRASEGDYAVSSGGALIAHVEDPQSNRTADLEITPLLTVTVTPFAPDVTTEADVARIYQIPELFPQLNADQQRFVSRTGRTIAAYSFGAAVLIGVLLALLLKRNLSPLAALTTLTRHAGPRSLPSTVPASGPREIRQLTEAFNEMAQRLDHAERSRQQMLTDLSHEIRGPLNNLRAELEAMQDGLINPSGPAINSLHEEVLLLSRLVNDLNELALADARTLPLSPQPTNVNELVEECGRRYALLFLNQSVTLRVSTAAALPVISADHQRLTQAIGNLLTNAARYAPAGSTVTIRAHGDGSSVCVVVSDNGPGLPDEQYERIFERFYRTDSSRTRETGGMGLGLAISRAIVEAHGGTICARATSPTGLTVEVCLPVTGRSSSKLDE